MDFPDLNPVPETGPPMFFVVKDIVLVLKFNIGLWLFGSRFQVFLDLGNLSRPLWAQMSIVEVQYWSFRGPFSGFWALLAGTLPEIGIRFVFPFFAMFEELLELGNRSSGIPRQAGFKPHKLIGQEVAQSKARRQAEIYISKKRMALPNSLQVWREGD